MDEVKTVEDNVIRIVEIKTKEYPKNSETPEIVRLTPTGKISHAKTRVYTQRYRKEWEHMADFKGIEIFAIICTLIPHYINETCYSV